MDSGTVRNIRIVCHVCVITYRHIAADPHAITYFRVCAHNRIWVDQCAVPHHAVMVQLHTGIQQYAVSNDRAVLHDRIIEDHAAPAEFCIGADIRGRVEQIWKIIPDFFAAL